jgi:hypothetical protein
MGVCSKFVEQKKLEMVPEVTALLPKNKLKKQEQHFALLEDDGAPKR